MTVDKPVVVLAGAGPGNGAPLARHFADAGYAVVTLSRHRATLAPTFSNGSFAA